MVSIRRARTVFTGVAGSPWYSNLYFQESTTSAEDATAFAYTFWSNLSAVTSDTVDYRVEGEVASIDSVTGDITGVTNVATGTGSMGDSAPMLPSATQGLLRIRTSVYANGRRIQGKIFVPGPTEARNNAGRPEDSYVNELNNAWDAANTDTNATPVVWSRSTGTAPIVTAASPWTQWAVLRSRRD